jgi:endo-1,4-beta-xylanase
MLSTESLRSLAKKNGLYLGTCANAHALANDPAYARIIAEQFNLITPENALKFGLVSPVRDEYDFSDVDLLVSFAAQHDLSVRGHVLVWDTQLPRWLTQGRFSRAELIGILQQHITTIVSRYAGSIKVWDVVNEAIDDRGQLKQTFWYNGIGPDFIEIAFRAARKADPTARLFYNDYGAEASPEHQDGVYRLLSDLKHRAVPVDGVGLQMHLSLENKSKETGYSVNTQRLVDLGLAFHITELDVRMKLDPASPAHDERLQASVYTAIFSEYILDKGCDTLILWGFTDRYSWIPFFYPGEGEATIMTRDYAFKPAYRSLITGLKKVQTHSWKANP